MTLLIILLILSPFLASITLMTPFFTNEEKAVRRFTKGYSILHLFLTSLLFIMFDFNTAGFSIDINANWIKTFGISFGFNIDSLTVLLLTLFSIIFIICTFLSKKMIQKNYKPYYSLILLLLGCIAGIVCAKDIFLLSVFWQLKIITMYLLINNWGDENKEKAAKNYLYYALSGSAFILLGFLLLYYYNFALNEVLSADITNIDLYQAPFELKTIIFTLLFVGFGAEFSIFPFWHFSKNVQTSTKTPVSILYSAIIMTLSAYSILKFNFQILNEVFAKYASVIILVGFLSLLIPSILIFRKKDLKEIISYYSILSMAIVLIGLCSLNETGITGAIYGILSRALIISGLFTITGIIQNKCGNVNIKKIKGLNLRLPKLMFLSIPIVFGAAGIPFFSKFISDFLCFTGAFFFDSENFIDTKLIVLLSLATSIITGCFIIYVFHKISFGNKIIPERKMRDINHHHLAIILTIIFFIIFLGTFPSLVTDVISQYSIINFNLLGAY